MNGSEKQIKWAEEIIEEVLYRFECIEHGVQAINTTQAQRDAVIKAISTMKTQLSSVDEAAKIISLRNTMGYEHIFRSLEYMMKKENIDPSFINYIPANKDNPIIPAIN